MTVTINGTSGITTPGVVNSGSETIASTLQVGGITTNVYPLVSGTAVASTSGTSIDFTSIPSWVKRITVMLNAVSLSGTSNIRVQIGSGTVITTGYVSGYSGFSSAGLTSSNTTSGFDLVTGNTAASHTYSGSCVLMLVSGNIWVASGNINAANASAGGIANGNITLGGTLDRVRITTVNGTDTFDAGSINILYE